MGSNPTLSVGMVLNGEVLEWPNRRDWKSRVPSQGEPWVRIPPSPPTYLNADTGLDRKFLIRCPSVYQYQSYV